MIQLEPCVSSALVVVGGSISFSTGLTAQSDVALQLRNQVRSVEACLVFPEIAWRSDVTSAIIGKRAPGTHEPLISVGADLDEWMSDIPALELRRASGYSKAIDLPVDDVDEAWK